MSKTQALRFAAQSVADRLEAWRDTAEYQLRVCPPTEESAWRNQRDNYAALILTLRNAIAESKP